MIIRLRDERRGVHVHTKVFVGGNHNSLALAGRLVMHIGEWQEFGAALLLGAARTNGRVVVEIPDDKNIVGASSGL